MKIEYKAKIKYFIKPEHPDIQYLKDWYVGKEYEFDDVYYIEDFFEKEEVIEYIKHDLRLVAGGGYNPYNIYGEVYIINGKKYY